MARLIAERYELVKKVDRVGRLDVELWLAQDHHAAVDTLVELVFYVQDRQPGLVHETFFARGKELSSLAHPKLPRLLDYGYDERRPGYYLVYERVQGRRLSFSLGGMKREPVRWILEVLKEICDGLVYLQAHSVPHGSLYPESVVLDSSGGLPLKLRCWGAASVDDLLILEDTTSEADVYDDLVEDDMVGLGRIALSLLTNKNDISREVIVATINNHDIPAHLRRFIARCFGPGEQYTSAGAATQDLQQAITEYECATTVYYLLSTKTAAVKLREMGYINKAESYMATDLLNEELNGEVFGRCEERDDGAIYFLTTARFRLVCAPDREQPQRNLVIVSVESPSPTSLIYEREQGLPIDASLTVVESPQKFAGNTPPITPLLDELVAHRLATAAKQQIRLADKSRIETWAKVIDLQRRLLSEFSLSYTDWELTDQGATLMVQLSTEPGSLDLAGDEYLRMTSVNGRGTPIVGFFEEMDGDRLRIGLARDVNPHEIAKTGRVTLDNLQVRTILERQKDALRRLKFNEAVNPYLFELLTLPDQLSADLPAPVTFLNPVLDKSQQEAVQRTLATHDLFLIQGPPGTGKTTAIIELVRQILRRDPHSRILIASQSNVAVNHAILSLLEVEPDLNERVVRVGREEKVGDTRDVLLNQQLLRWAERVRARSAAYLEQQKRTFSADDELVECLRLLNECEQKQDEADALELQIAQYRTELDEAQEQFKQLDRVVAEARRFRQATAALIPSIAEGDSTFLQVVREFDEGFLKWSESFLQEADRAVQLSERRATLHEKLSRLIGTSTNLHDEVRAGEGMVQDILTEKYGVCLMGLTAQRQFIERRLAKERTQALQFGRLQKVAEGWAKQLGKDDESFTGAYLNKAQVIGATCIGIAAKGDVGEAEFDWVIVDEAGRATHPEILVPLVRGRKLALVGDHRQLPPILDQELKGDVLEEIGVSRGELETSLFQEVITAVPQALYTTLRTQYRMHPAIGNLISYCFYDKQLRHGVEPEGRDHGLDWCHTPVLWYSTCRLPHNQERKVGYSYQNLSEVHFIHDLLDRMEATLSVRNEQKKVGIITGYMAQKRLLRQQLEVSEVNAWPHLQVEINTVDAYQGREMDYIIYTLVRSNPQGYIGFLRDPRRVNVALSRARELLIVVGNHHTAGTATTYGAENPFYTVLKHVRQHPGECTLEEVQP